MRNSRLTVRFLRITLCPVKHKPSRAFPNLRAYLDDMDRRGVSQKDFAADMDMSEGYLSDLKNGRVKPSLTLAKRLADRCNVPIESFLEVGVS